jgi:WXG100 family type VII secretion target
MSGDRLVVNFAALQQAGVDIQNAISKMETELHECESAAGPLVQTWEGAAQQAYQERQMKWRQAAGDLSQMLRNIKAAVEDSANDYQETENRNVNMFS